MQMKNSLTLIILFSLLVVSACQEDDLSQGVNSLRGAWQVRQAVSIYGEGDNARVDEAGNLGWFNFDGDTLRFEYTRNDTLYRGSERWQLYRDRENQGFVKVNVFTLKIEDYDTFVCEFGNQTRNAEKNATSITLRHEPELMGQDTWFELSLTKN